MRTLLTMVTLFLLLGTQAWAQTNTYYVSANGSNSNNGTTDLTPFATLSYAVSTAGSGDIINVMSASGAIVEAGNQIAIGAKSLTIQGYNGVIATVQRTGGSSYFFYSSGGGTATLTLKDLVIDASSSTSTNFLVHIYNMSSVTIDDVEVIGQGKNYTTDGQPYYYTNASNTNVLGGVDLNTVTTATVTDLTVSDVGRNGFATLDVGTLSLSNLTAEDCGHSSSTGWAGLALYGTTTSLTISGSNTIDNVPIGVNAESGITLPSTPASTIAITNAVLPVAAASTAAGQTFARVVTGNPYMVVTTGGTGAGYFDDVTDAVSAAVAWGTTYSVDFVIIDLAVDQYIVGPGMKIQAAINHASAGDQINVLAGTYAENITVSKRLSIIGSTSGVTPTSIVTASTGSVFAIQASGLSSTSPVLIKNFKVEVGTYGFNIGTGTSYLELDGVFVTGTSSAPYQGVGIKLATTASADHLTIRNSKFSRMQHGIAVEKSSSAPSPLSTLTDVLIEDTEFSENRQKGMYFEKLSNAQFTRVSLIDNGFDNTVAWGQGLDINLKYGSYSNLTFTDLYVSGNGVGTGSMGAGVNIKARDDGATYGANPATLTNVRVIGGQFIGNSHAGLRFGEPGQSNAGPTNVIVSGAQFDNNVTFGLENVTTATVDARHNWWGDNSGPYHATTNTIGTGDAVSDYVLYNPWTLRNAITATGTPYSFDADFDGNADVQMTFSTLPPGGGNVYIDRYSSIPAHWPAPPTNALTNTYLIITTDMPNYSFDVNVVLTYLGSGFGTNTQAAYYNEDSEEWIIIGGTYTDNSTAGPSIDDTYAFITNHFTPFVFINTPTTPLVLELTDMVVSDDFDESTLPTSPTLTEPWQQWMGGGDLTDDWSWKYQRNTVSVIPMTTGADIFAATIKLRYDPTDWQLLDPAGFTNGVRVGSLFTNATYSTFFFQMAGTVSTDNTILADVSVQEAGNPMVTADAVKSLADFAFQAIAANPSPITFLSAAIRDNLNQAYYVDLSDDSKGRIYLGDVVRTTGTGYAHDAGDGVLNTDDLTAWAPSYFSDVSAVNHPGSLGNYRLKYDVGPTSTNYIDGMPEPDGKIEFEDLVIFAISYGLSQNNSYPKTTSPQNVSMTLAAETFEQGEWIDARVRMSHAQDLRALSLGIEYDLQSLSFEGVVNGSLLPQGSPFFVKDDNGVLRIDVATLYEAGVSGAGDVLVLRFRARQKGSDAVRLVEALARDSRNNPIGVRTMESAVPTQISLEQNYPNPFNPSTVISYALPEAQVAELAVFDLLGRKVRVLVDAALTEGMHSISFDGRDDAGNMLPSGIYIYRLVAGDAVTQRSMMLSK